MLNKEELHAKYGETLVGVVEAGVFEGINGWDASLAGFNLMDEAELEYKLRYEMEIDPSYRQVIPYILVADIKGRYFVTRRKGGDARLTGKIALGVGGHIDDKESVCEAAYRELSEELVLPENNVPFAMTKLGCIVLNENEVDKVHAGLVFRCVMYEDVEIREKDELEGFWMTKEEMREHIDEFESWAQVLIRNNAIDIPLTFGDVARGLVLQYIRKNADYKNSFHETHKKFGATAGFVRISDKIQRLSALESGVHNVLSESLYDTLGDAATYCVMQAAELGVEKADDINEDSQNLVARILTGFMSSGPHVGCGPYVDADEAYKDLMEAHRIAKSTANYKDLAPCDTPSYKLLCMASRFITTWITRKGAVIEMESEKAA